MFSVLYHVGPSSLGFFMECWKIITDSNLQIQSYKIQVQIKPKLHQLWRIALCLSKFHFSVFVKIVWVFWLERIVPPLERRSQMFVYRPFRFSLSLPKACSQARRIYICNRKLSFIDQATGLEIKKIFRLPFGDQPEKYSRQMQIFSRQFVKCKWRPQLIGTGLLIFRAGAEPWNSQKHAK